MKGQAQGPERNYIAGMPTFVGLSVYLQISRDVNFANCTNEHRFK